MKELRPYDFIALRLIGENPHISQRRLHREINQWILDNGVTPDYAEVRLYKISTETAISHLRQAGLLQEGKSLMVNGAHALDLWRVIGQDWRGWPWSIPIENGRAAYYLIKERL